jgi:hypothetical protein
MRIVASFRLPELLIRPLNRCRVLNIRSTDVGGTLLAVPSSDPHRMLCTAAWAPAENDGSCEMIFAVRRKALVRWETEPALVLSVAPLVREANARVNDRVILRESDVGTSLDVIHSTFGCLNSASSRRRGRQKSVSPSGEELRLAWVSKN